jgi:hypothetical protein
VINSKGVGMADMEEMNVRLANFEFIDHMLMNIVKVMLQELRLGWRSNTLWALPTEKHVNPVYPTFEIFSYLLFQLDSLAALYQEEKTRKGLFHFLADRMLGTLTIEKEIFNNVLNRRMQEYGGIQVAESLATDSRLKKLLQGFLDNLTYAISKQDLFCWEGETKPSLLIDANELLLIHAIYNDLWPMEIRFRIMVRHLLTGLHFGERWSKMKVQRIIDAATEEIREIGL